MDRTARNQQVFNRCQLNYDNMLPPEYWEGPEDDEQNDFEGYFDEDDVYECYSGILGEG